MENKKMTKVEALEMVIALFAKEEVKDLVSDELADKIEAMKEQEIKVASRKKGKGTSKVAKEKEANMQKVRDGFKKMETVEPLTLVEIGALIGLDDATPQKLSAIMKPLVDNGEFEKTQKDKKVAYQPTETE